MPHWLLIVLAVLAVVILVAFVFLVIRFRRRRAESSQTNGWADRGHWDYDTLDLPRPYGQGSYGTEEEVRSPVTYPSPRREPGPGAANAGLFNQPTGVWPVAAGPYPGAAGSSVADGGYADEQPRHGHGHGGDSGSWSNGD